MANAYTTALRHGVAHVRIYLMLGRNRAVPFLIVFCLSLVLGTVGCGKQGSASAAGGPPPAFRVKVQVAQPQRVGEFTEYIATLKSRNATILQPQVEGYITNIL